jgi:hypothetical protein
MLSTRVVEAANVGVTDELTGLGLHRVDDGGFEWALVDLIDGFFKDANIENPRAAIGGRSGAVRFLGWQDSSQPKKQACSSSLITASAADRDFVSGRGG